MSAFIWRICCAFAPHKVHYISHTANIPGHAGYAHNARHKHIFGVIRCPKGWLGPTTRSLSLHACPTLPYIHGEQFTPQVDYVRKVDTSFVFDDAHLFIDRLLEDTSIQISDEFADGDECLPQDLDRVSPRSQAVLYINQLVLALSKSQLCILYI